PGLGADNPVPTLDGCQAPQPRKMRLCRSGTAGDTVAESDGTSGGASAARAHENLRVHPANGFGATAVELERRSQTAQLADGKLSDVRHSFPLRGSSHSLSKHRRRSISVWPGNE